MNTERITQATLIVFLAVLLYFTFIIIQPFIVYLVFAMILGYIFYPFYERLLEKIKSKNLASSIILVLILLIIIIPSIVIVGQLVGQANFALNTITDTDLLEKGTTYFNQITGMNIDITKTIENIVNQARNFIVENATTFLTSAFDIIIGVFIMFFSLFFIFKRGPELINTLVENIPLKKKHSKTIIQEVRKVTHAVIHGQIIIAVVQGILGGVGFAVLGVPNPIFWGFIMMILSFLPMIGPFIVWAPAVVYILMQGQIWQGIVLFVYSLIIVSGIDNILRPKLLSSQASIHPVIALIGVLGGLKVLGMVGFVLGPLILALIIVFFKFLNEEMLGKA